MGIPKCPFRLICRASLTVLHITFQGLYGIGHGTVLDSGTTFTYLPSQAFEQLHTHVSDYALSHGLHTLPGPDSHFQDTCFGGAPSFDQSDKLREVFPSLELQFKVSVRKDKRLLCRSGVV